ncbi:hypothetical protein R1flu_023575 [Riccia fluitans]|uniref:Uncharacterized protein n=1 Tax=Riccia fluitans TaxID=41844 RepID=A0ABD1XT81_9MARC
MGNTTDISGLAVYFYFLFGVSVLGLLLLKEMLEQNRRRSQQLEETTAKIAILFQEGGAHVVQIPEHLLVVRVEQPGTPSGDGVHVKEMAELPAGFSKDRVRLKDSTDGDVSQMAATIKQ